MKFTEAQKRVIDLREKNILVSAAAGSGKTAVLVQRILQMISDEAHPVDIDHLLIVTFTKAAAAEMRGRLYDRISEALRENPGNRHLARQLQLLPGALICTIDAFCTYVLRNHFHEIGLDPAFRVGDEAEMRLLQQDTLAELLEEEYQKADPAFLHLTEALSEGKTDEKIEKEILDLFRTAESAPWPDTWLSGVLNVYEADTVEEVLESEWLSGYIRMLPARVRSYADDYERYAVSAEARGYEALSAFFREEGAGFIRASEFQTYEEAVRCLSGMQFLKRPSAPKGFTPEEKKEYQAFCKATRDVSKDNFGKLSKVLPKDPSAILESIRNIAPMARELVRLVRAFREKFAEKKRAENLVDFGDIEHLALQILRNEAGEYTETADEFSAFFAEIMVDEYQDSNYVQEEILTAVSKERFGTQNFFMVGDMKQSIYRFRMARPELFTGKYQHFLEAPEDGEVIELQENFRSDTSVIRSVNELFFCLMQDSVGGITYTEAQQLNPGGADGQDRTAFETELHILDLSDTVSEEMVQENAEGAAEDPSSEGYTVSEWEARMTAGEIRKLMDAGTEIYDGSLGAMRPLQYRDIAILMRSAAGRDKSYQEVLASEGIPAYAESRTGYYDSYEVLLLLDLLQIIDNPMNDISLASVMHSPVFGFTAEELSLLGRKFGAAEEGNGFYGAVKNYILHTGKDDPLHVKADAFLQRLAGYRRAAGERKLSMLIRYLYEDTGLYVFLSAMPGGLRRQGNLQILLTKAEAFESTSYHGIFQFIRYVDKLKSSAIEEGEAGTSGEADDAVRIMTVHKSKGLQFPVVFLVGTGRKLSGKNDRKTVIHPDLGLGLDEIDTEKRIRRRSLVRELLVQKNKADEFGEELRILYVALTRAKNKLYMMGTCRDLSKLLGKYEEGFTLPGRMPASYDELMSSETVLDWLLLAYRDDAGISLSFHTAEELTEHAVASAAEKRITEGNLLSSLASCAEAEPGRIQAVQEALDAPPVQDELYSIPATLSVSRIKMMYYPEGERYYSEQPEVYIDDTPEQAEEETGEGRTGSAGETENPAPRPDFMEPAQEESLSAADLGTLYHKVLELMNPFEPVEAQLSGLENAGLISPMEKDRINPYKLRCFFRSPLGKRMANAMENGKCYKERQFIMGVPIRLVYPERVVSDSEELIMVQGIIDLYFEEEDGLVLVDYKTDHVDSEEALMNRYRKQLELYRDALSRTTGKPVKEMYLYSLYFNKEIKG